MSYSLTKFGEAIRKSCRQLWLKKDDNDFAKKFIALAAANIHITMHMKLYMPYKIFKALIFATQRKDLRGHAGVQLAHELQGLNCRQAWAFSWLTSDSVLHVAKWKHKDAEGGLIRAP